MQENDSVYDELLKNQDISFQLKMAQHQLVGELTNWRTNVKNNVNRAKVLAGRNKILNLVLR